MVSAVRQHGVHVDWSSSAVHGRLEANLQAQAASTRAALEQQREAAAMHDLGQRQRSLLDLLA